MKNKLHTDIRKEFCSSTISHNNSVSYAAFAQPVRFNILMGKAFYILKFSAFFSVKTSIPRKYTVPQFSTVSSQRFWISKWRIIERKKLRIIQGKMGDVFPQKVFRSLERKLFTKIPENILREKLFGIRKELFGITSIWNVRHWLGRTVVPEKCKYVRIDVSNVILEKSVY